VRQTVDAFSAESPPPIAAGKKFDEARDIWQGRVNAGWRFYFSIEGDAYYLLDIIPHPK
jgi:hypothetical protein